MKRLETPQSGAGKPGVFVELTRIQALKLASRLECIASQIRTIPDVPTSLYVPDCSLAEWATNQASVIEVEVAETV